jgi:hypothetical protein
MINEWIGNYIAWKWAWPFLRYHFGFCLEKLKKDTKHHRQDSRPSARDSILRPVEYTSEALKFPHTYLDNCYQNVLSFTFQLNFKRDMVNNQVSD